MKYNHPLLSHFVSKVRDIEISQLEFRRNLGIIAKILFIEASRQEKTKKKIIRMWRGPLELELLDQTKIVLVGILRGAMGMVDGITELVPDVPVGFIASTRNSETLEVTTHYTKLPKLSGKNIYLIDVMIGTGSSMSKAISLIKEEGPLSIKCISAIASPQGIAKLEKDHPDVQLYMAEIDSELDSRGMISPGTGDIGERSFNQADYNKKFYTPEENEERNK